MLPKAYVAVALHGGGMASLQLEPYRVEGPQAQAFKFLKLVTAAVGAAAHPGIVVQLQCSAYGGVERCQVMVYALTHCRVDAAVYELDGALHQGLVPGFAHTGRDDRTAVMFGKGGVVLVELPRNGSLSSRPP